MSTYPEWQRLAREAQEQRNQAKEEQARQARQAQIELEKRQGELLYSALSFLVPSEKLTVPSENRCQLGNYIFELAEVHKGDYFETDRVCYTVRDNQTGEPVVAFRLYIRYAEKDIPWQGLDIDERFFDEWDIWNYSLSQELGIQPGKPFEINESNIHEWSNTLAEFGDLLDTAKVNYELAVHAWKKHVERQEVKDAHEDSEDSELSAREMLLNALDNYFMGC